MLCPPQVPFEAASKAFADAGTPEWVIKGSMQLYELMNAGCSGLSVDDFVAITGKQPTSVQQWVESIKEGFTVKEAAASDATVRASIPTCVHSLHVS